MSAYIVIINVLCIINLMFITLLANLVVTKLKVLCDGHVFLDTYDAL